MFIEPKQTQYLSYQNGFIRGICKSKDSVLVTWSTGFAQSASAEAWNAREFVQNPEKARLLSGDEEKLAVAFFEKQTQEMTRRRSMKL